MGEVALYLDPHAGGALRGVIVEPLGGSRGVGLLLVGEVAL